MTTALIFVLLALASFGCAAWRGKTVYVLSGFSRLCSAPVLLAALLLLYRRARRKELSASRR